MLVVWRDTLKQTECANAPQTARDRLGTARLGASVKPPLCLRPLSVRERGERIEGEKEGGDELGRVNGRGTGSEGCECVRERESQVCSCECE